jgi:hypothetical protein
MDTRPATPATPTLFKGLAHEIFTVFFWLEWIYLGLNGTASGYQF